MSCPFMFPTRFVTPGPEGHRHKSVCINYITTALVPVAG